MSTANLAVSAAKNLPTRKTAVWRWALDRHRRAGHRVLLARASEEECQLPIVGLIDLFEDVPVDDQLLVPDLDRVERGHRVLSTLRALAADTPVILAIDDVQWLDPVTADALRYALRRLEDEPGPADAPAADLRTHDEKH